MVQFLRHEHAATSIELSGAVHVLTGIGVLHCRLLTGCNLSAGEHCAVAQGALIRIVLVVRVKVSPEQGRSDQDRDVTDSLQNEPRLRVLLNAGDRRQEDGRCAHQENGHLDTARLDIQPLKNLMFDP